jgi:uncharacterized protein YecE (DUF72 family)
MLAFYARRFPTVEVNFTYYRMPTARTTAAMVKKAPGLVFTVKLPGEITHEGKLTREAVKQYRDGVEPMLAAGVLGCVLAQFPWGFKYTPEAMAFLTELGKRLGDLKPVAEFRNAAWATDAVYKELKRLNVGFCNVDEPHLRGLMPATDVVTSEIAYFRFHGRNAKEWWKHDEAAQRYNYLYKQDELAEWVPRVKKAAAKAETTYIFMNNHPLGQAVVNAEMMMEMLGEHFKSGGDAALF